jgi:hypothetical protein
MDTCVRIREIAEIDRPYEYRSVVERNPQALEYDGFPFAPNLVSQPSPGMACSSAIRTQPNAAALLNWTRSQVPWRPCNTSPSEHAYAKLTSVARCGTVRRVCRLARSAQILRTRWYLHRRRTSSGGQTAKLGTWDLPRPRNLNDV